MGKRSAARRRIVGKHAAAAVLRAGDLRVGSGRRAQRSFVPVSVRTPCCIHRQQPLRSRHLGGRGERRLSVGMLISTLSGPAVRRAMPPPTVACPRSRDDRPVPAVQLSSALRSTQLQVSKAAARRPTRTTDCSQSETLKRMLVPHSANQPLAGQPTRATWPFRLSRKICRSRRPDLHFECDWLWSVVWVRPSASSGDSKGCPGCNS